MTDHNFPSVTVESACGERDVRLSVMHLTDRRVFLDGEIDADMANRFLMQMLYLEKEPEKPVTIYINSGGGEVNAGLMIYDILRSSPLTANLVCTGRAASMAAILLAAGRKGRRYCLAHSQIMIHEPLLAGGVGGSATSIHVLSNSILATRDTLNGILAEHTGRSLEEINKATSYDNFMNAEEAIRFGICDAVMNSITVQEREETL